VHGSKLWGIQLFDGPLARDVSPCGLAVLSSITVPSTAAVAIDRGNDVEPGGLEALALKRAPQLRQAVAKACLDVGPFRKEFRLDVSSLNPQHHPNVVRVGVRVSLLRFGCCARNSKDEPVPG
jgi:hypothetical protein